jgi:hypothetical protein
MVITVGGISTRILEYVAEKQPILYVCDSNKAYVQYWILEKYAIFLILFIYLRS